MGSSSEELNLEPGDQVGSSEKGSCGKGSQGQVSCAVTHSNTERLRPFPEFHGEKLKGSDISRYAF